MITIRYMIIGTFLFFLMAFAGGTVFLNMSTAYNESGLSPAIDVRETKFINNLNETIARGESAVSLTGLAEGVDAKIRTDEGIDLLKTGLEIGKLLTTIPNILLGAITDIGTFIGLPEWVSLIFITMIVIIVTLSVAAALLRWYI